MKGLLFEFLVLKTRTAFPVGDVVEAGTVAVVTSGTDVGARQSKPLQGHPAKQFSLIFRLNFISFGSFFLKITSQGQSSCLVLNRAKQSSSHCSLLLQL